MSEAKRNSSSRRRTALRSEARPVLRVIETPRPALSPGTAPASAPVPTWVRRYRLRLSLTDMAIVALAVMIAFVARFWWGETAEELGQLVMSYSALAGLIIVTWIVTLGAYRTRDARVVGVGVTEYRRVVGASFVAFGLLAIFLVVAKVDVARGFFILALPIGLAALVASRWLWRLWLVRQRAEGNFQSRVIVVGDVSDVKYVVSQMDKKGSAAYNVVGAAVNGDVVDTVLVNGRNVSVVANLENVATAAAYLRVDAVIVAGQPDGGGQFIRDLGWDLEGTTAELVVASRLTNVAGPRIHFRPVDGLPLMHVELPQYEGGKHIMKRVLDIVASGGALLFLLPLMLVIGLLVRLDSSGPILFTQERVGRGGKPFRMLKFRSMVQTAEDDLVGLLDKNEGAGVLFKMKNDPRVTHIGRFLRKYSLDELPQLWNIFIGEMSLVGPRPPLQSEVALYGDRVHRRLYIKPGLTGMWQVNGRSNLDWDESVRLDLYYVENWSLAGDLVIMWRTLKVLRNASGAY